MGQIIATLLVAGISLIFFIGVAIEEKIDKFKVDNTVNAVNTINIVEKPETDKNIYHIYDEKIESIRKLEKLTKINNINDKYENDKNDYKPLVIKVNFKNKIPDNILYDNSYICYEFTSTYTVNYNKNESKGNSLKDYLINDKGFGMACFHNVYSNNLVNAAIQGEFENKKVLIKGDILRHVKIFDEYDKGIISVKYLKELK